MTTDAIEAAQQRLADLSKAGAAEAHQQEQERADLTLAHMAGFESGKDVGCAEGAATIADLRRQLAVAEARAEEARSMASFENGRALLLKERAENAEANLKEILTGWDNVVSEFLDADSASTHDESELAEANFIAAFQAMKTHLYKMRVVKNSLTTDVNAVLAQENPNG